MINGLVFAAGLGTRLKPLTDTMPKALVPLAGKTLLQWQVERLRGAGITNIVVNVHHFPDLIIDTIRANNGWGCHITVSDERDCLLDTGGGLRKAWREGLFGKDEPVLACNVDILSNIDLRALIKAYRSSTLPSDGKSTGVSQLVVSERRTQRYLLFDEKDTLCGWTNIATGEMIPSSLKSLITNAPSSIATDPSPVTPLAFSGMQILSPEVLKRLDEVEEEKFSMIPFYLRIMDSEPLHAFVPANYRMMDVGKIDQITAAESFAESLLA